MRAQTQQTTLTPVFAFYVFLLAVAAIGAAAYLLLFFSDVPGAHEERFGALAELPRDLGKWVKSKKPDEEGLIREKRCLLDESAGGTKFLLQVRYRNPVTRKIIRIEPERRVKRQRIPR